MYIHVRVTLPLEQNRSASADIARKCMHGAWLCMPCFETVCTHQTMPRSCTYLVAFHATIPYSYFLPFGHEDEAYVSHLRA